MPGGNTKVEGREYCTETEYGDGVLVTLALSNRLSCCVVCINALSYVWRTPYSQALPWTLCDVTCSVRCFEGCSGGHSYILTGRSLNGRCMLCPPTRAPNCKKKKNFFIKYSVVMHHHS